MHTYRNPADLAAVLTHLAPFAPLAVLAAVTFAEADDDALRFYADDDFAPVATIFADGACELVA
jgi:hypothetical protein